MGAFSRLVGRFSARTEKPAAPAGQTPQPRRDTDRWCSGDLAECIHEGPWYRQGLIPVHSGPGQSEVRIVRNVRIGKDLLDGSPIELLIFDAYPGHAYVARCFRKIVPRADAAQSADRRFVDKLRKASLPFREHA